MIPITLSVRNFLCYREGVPSLDFSGLRLACLCGPNGHGKSALLDAITWCLWGQARGKTHDELISHGADECRVMLNFLARGNDYSVERTHKIGGKRSSGTTTLELAVWSNDALVTNLVGATIRETQEQIIQIVGMDYDTFINSAFLLQGRADEFSSKPPGERKAVLAKILGLEEYDVLQSRAKVELQEVTRSVARDEGALTLMGDEQGSIGYPSVALAAVESSLRELGPQIEAQDREVASFKATVADLERKKGDLDGLQRQIGGIWAERSNLEAQLVAARERVAKYQDLIQHTDTIRAGADRLSEAKSVFARMENKRRTHEALIVGKNKAEAAIDSARSFLAARQDQLEQQANDVAQEALRLSVVIADASKPGAHCPLCQQALGQEERERVREQTRKEIEECKARLAQAEAAGSRIVDALEDNSFEPEAFNQHEEITQKIATLAYNEEVLCRAYADMQELESFGARLTSLTEADIHLPQEEAAVQQAMDMLEARSVELARLEAQKYNDAAAILGLPLQQTDLAWATEALVGLELDRATALDRRGYLRGQVDRLAGLQTEMAVVEKRLTSSRDDQAIYQELVTAFGKTGVQAMLIETVVPRLEEEANALLGRMTDGAMQITLETQKEKRSAKGELAETLEIYVSDEWGPRHYEMYSGGEAFRVNLALRIALSRVLAQRTGAPMPVLFIDEGFGSQDMAGRERVMDAIGAISEDFELIVVITHLDELKDLFPTRIEVQKGANGSTFSVS